MFKYKILLGHNFFHLLLNQTAVNLISNVFHIHELKLYFTEFIISILFNLFTQVDT